MLLVQTEDQRDRNLQAAFLSILMAISPRCSRTVPIAAIALREPRREASYVSQYGRSPRLWSAKSARDECKVERSMRRSFPPELGACGTNCAVPQRQHDLPCQDSRAEMRRSARRSAFWLWDQ